MDAEHTELLGACRRRLCGQYALKSGRNLVNRLDDLDVAVRQMPTHERHILGPPI